MVSTRKTLALLDETIEAQQKTRYSRRIGASGIGRECSREIWYKFHWINKTLFKARILRLFERGNLEEARFVRWFENMGVTVWSENDDRQYFISDVFGHFAGYLDGMGLGAPDLPAQPFVFEYKTHGEKSFKLLIKDKVKKSKFEHYIQMQIYMYKRKLKWALYCAVCKNTDALHLEWVALDKKLAQKYIERAEHIIFSEEAPIRISNKATWFKCRFCDYNTVCHGNELPDINCRTCAHSTPERTGDGAWSCQLGLPRIHILPERGCWAHIYNPHVLNGVQCGDGNLEENWLDFTLKNGKKIKHGPDHITGAVFEKAYKFKKAK